MEVNLCGFRNRLNKNLEPLNEMNRVLMIAYVFPPIAYAGSFRTLRFCRYLIENKWLPIVLTIKRGDDLDNDDSLLKKIPAQIKVHRTRTVDFWRFWRRRKKLKKDKFGYGTESIDNQGGFGNRKKRTIFWLSYFKKIVLELVTTPDHMVFWIPFAVAKGILLLLRYDIKVVYTSSPPHSEHLVGLFLAKLFGKPWVADFRDPMLDSSGYEPGTYFRRCADRGLEKLIVHHAQKVLIISDFYTMIMKKRYPQFAEKFFTLPNGYDPADFEMLQPEPYKKFTIIYAGSFYANRSPDFFLRSFGSWFKSQSSEIQKNVQVIFYGIIPMEVTNRIKEEGLLNVVMTPGMIPKNKLAPKLLGADVLLLIIGFDQESRGTITSKIFEYMACNRPILAIIPQGDAADILRNYKRAFLLTCEDSFLLRKYLAEAYDAYVSIKKNESIENKNNDKIGTSAEYNARNQTRVLAQIFNQII